MCSSIDDNTIPSGVLALVDALVAAAKAAGAQPQTAMTETEVAVAQSALLVALREWSTEGALPAEKTGDIQLTETSQIWNNPRVIFDRWAKLPVSVSYNPAAVDGICWRLHQDRYQIRIDGRDPYTVLAGYALVVPRITASMLPFIRSKGVM